MKITSKSVRNESIPNNKGAKDFAKKFRQRFFWDRFALPPNRIIRIDATYRFVYFPSHLPDPIERDFLPQIAMGHLAASAWTHERASPSKDYGSQTFIFYLQ
jgi:hypothetical protein